MKIFITGADGFIGSHLADKLLASGHEVIGLVNYNSFGSWGWLERYSKKTPNNLSVVLGDIRDQGHMRSLVKDADLVIHMAALIAIPFSYVAPETYLNTNCLGTLNILNAVRDSGVSRMIHISTSEVYGTAHYVPIDEEHPIVGQSPYSASKIAADQMVAAFNRSFDLPVTTIRPFNTFGPRQSARAIIPTIITQLKADGSKLELGNLDPTRDLTFVTDTVDGIISAAFSSKGIGETFNLGTGYEISIKDLALLIAELMDCSPGIVLGDSRLRPKASEVDRLLSNNQKIKNCFGWQPEHSGAEGLKAGLQKTIDWFSNPANLSKYKHGIFNV